MKKYYAIVLLILTTVFSPFSYSTQQPASAESIKELLQLTGGGDMGVTIIKKVIDNSKGLCPDAPDEFWEQIMADIDSDKLERLLVPIYQKHLTGEDVRNLNEFYRSPTGKKLIAAQPAIMQEAFIVGEQWGREVGESVYKKIEQRNSSK